MATLLSEGWESNQPPSYYTGLGWTAGGGFGVDTQYGSWAPEGSYSAWIQRNGVIETPNTTFDDPEITFSFTFRLRTSDQWRTNAGNVVEFKDGGVVYAYAIPTGASSSETWVFWVYNGTAFENAGSTTTSFAQGTDYNIAIDVKSDGAPVEITVRVDSVEEINFTATAGSGYSCDSIAVRGAVDGGDFLFIDALLVEEVIAATEEVQMRQESQHWDKIGARLSIVDTGVGQTGLTVTVAIKRQSDGLWLANGGASWAAGFATNNAAETDATNLPGVYEYSVPVAQLGNLEQDGYLIKVAESTTPVLEYVHVTPVLTAEAVRMLALRQENMKVNWTSWNSSGEPVAGVIYIYPDKTAADADAVPDGTGKIASYSVAAAYDASLRQTLYTSTKDA